MKRIVPPGIVLVAACGFAVAVAGSARTTRLATPTADSIQKEIDAAEKSSTDKTVTLPAGDIVLNKPLRIRGTDLRFRGSPDGPTRLFGQFTGHTLVAQPESPLPANRFGASLVPGPGQALRLLPGSPSAQRLPVTVYTEPALDLSERTEFSVGYFFRRLTATPSAGVHFFFGGRYGHRNIRPLAVWDWFGGLGLEWNGQVYHAPGAAQDLNKTYFVAVTYSAGTVKLKVAEPGQQLTTVLSFPAQNPFRGGGVEPLAFGQDVNGPLGDQAAWGGPDGYLDSFHVSRVERYTGLAPATKGTPDPDTLFLMRFETDGDVLVGRGRTEPGFPQGVPSYVVPDSPEVHVGSVQLSDIGFEGSMGCSGPLLRGTIFSRVERLNFNATYTGIVYRGTTYGSTARDVHGNAQSYAWLQGPQSMQFNGDSIRVGSFGKGIIWYQAGAVGGSFRGLYLTPYSPCVASMYIAETNDINIDAGQVDDEGQAGVVDSVVILDRQAWPKFRGFLFAGNRGTLVDLSRGASAHFDGSWFHVPASADPLLRFRDNQVPAVKVTMPAFRTTAPGNPISNRPEWVSTSPVIN